MILNWIFFVVCLAWIASTCYTIYDAFFRKTMGSCQREARKELNRRGEEFEWWYKKAYQRDFIKWYIETLYGLPTGLSVKERYARVAREVDVLYSGFLDYKKTLAVTKQGSKLAGINLDV